MTGAERKAIRGRMRGRATPVSGSVAAPIAEAGECQAVSEERGERRARERALLGERLIPFQLQPSGAKLNKRT